MHPNLHLFSTPGQNGINDIVEASRPYLLDRDDPLIAYLPLASLYEEKWLDLNSTAFKGLARFQTVNTELMTQREIETILREASLAYVPGGNTFLLNHRLHMSGIMLYLRKKLQAGLPLVGFSAGAIICGPNILTSTDMNTVGTAYFDGLSIIPFNISPHYPPDAYSQSVKDGWLSDYHFFHDNPIILLADGAYVKVDGNKSTLVRGEAWILRKDQEKEKLDAGKSIVL
jgi:peptidase E